MSIMSTQQEQHKQQQANGSEGNNIENQRKQSSLLIIRGRGRGMRRVGGLLTSQARPIKAHDDNDDESHCSWSELCERHKKLLSSVIDLPRRGIREEVYQAVYEKDIRRVPIFANFTQKQIERERYYDIFDSLLQVETVHQDVEMRRYDMRNKTINQQKCCIDVPGLSNGQPSLVPGDFVVIHDDNFEIKEIFPIRTTKGDSVILYERKCHANKDILSKPINIAFYSSGSLLETCRNALVRSERPGISELIWESVHDELSEGKRLFRLDWNEEEFVDRFNNFTGDSYLEKLFKTPCAHLAIRKVYLVNPGMEPNTRGTSPNYNYDKEFFTLYNAACGKMIPDNDDRVIIQSSKSLKTVVLPFKERYPFVKIVEDYRREIIELLSEPSLDFMFVAASLIQSAGLEDSVVLTDNQPSLRELFHGSREEVDSIMACDRPKIDSIETETPELAARLDKLNEPQRQAVLAILEARYRPSPYILFGPPGTGKTHTLVEAVVQIYLRDPRAKILFCANSNTCADQIYEKIEKTGAIAANDYERIRAGDSITGKGFRRIIVTTNMKAGGFMAQNQKFDYVILDEAGHAHEPESLVPISTLETSNGLLVLAGDPKQLGPVVMNRQAGELGLGKSLLERIFEFKSYDRHHPYGRYNQYYITKLLYCYRCDPDILEISNKLFYDQELKYVNKTPRSIMKIMNLGKSVQFHHISGRENQPPWSTSWRNYNEVSACVEIVLLLYRIGIDASQVGVITPYKLQAKEIQKALRNVLQSYSSFFDKRYPNKTTLFDAETIVSPTDDLISNLTRLNLNDNSARNVNTERAKKVDLTPLDRMCKIDTVDAFQGNEREIIIISTVRTDSSRHLDFMNDARRFNVAISRAKWLVITIGHKSVLDRGDLWPEYLKHAETGDISKWRKNTVDRDPFKNNVLLFKA